MKMEGVVIKVLHMDKVEADTSRFGFEEMYSPRQNLKNSFLYKLMRALDALDEGATITLEPILSFDDEYEAAWTSISRASQLRICGLLSAGSKISAIKLVREETGWGIKEAKRLIDSEWEKGVKIERR